MLFKIPLKPDDYVIKIFVGDDYEAIEYYQAGFKLTILPSLNLDRESPDHSQGSIMVDEQWL